MFPCPGWRQGDVKVWLVPQTRQGSLHTPTSPSTAAARGTWSQYASTISVSQDSIVVKLSPSAVEPSEDQSPRPLTPSQWSKTSVCRSCSDGYDEEVRSRCQEVTSSTRPYHCPHPGLVRGPVTSRRKTGANIDTALLHKLWLEGDNLWVKGGNMWPAASTPVSHEMRRTKSGENCCQHGAHGVRSGAQYQSTATQLPV